MRVSDFDELVEQAHGALAQIVSGDPEGYKAIYSQQDDISLASPFGGIACTRTEVEERLERAAANFRDGTVRSIKTLEKTVGKDLAYLVEIERLNARLGGRENLTRVTLRATSIFRHEDDGWKLVHRHVDPRMSPQTAESLMEGWPYHGVQAI